MTILMKKVADNISVHRSNGIVQDLGTVLMKLNYVMATRIVLMELMKKIAVSVAVYYC